jgi:sugar lactone lactonase YvrE
VATYAGSLYIADTNNGRVRKVDFGTGLVNTVVGCSVSGGGDGGPATSAGLHMPQSVALDSFGNIYVAESSCVRKVVQSTGLISTYAGNPNIGNFGGDGGPATAALLNLPVSLALDGGGNLYIVDSENGLVRRVDSSTGLISTAAGMVWATDFSGDGGPATAASLNYAYGVAVDSGGNIYIGDTQNNRVRKVASSTGVINTVVGGYPGDGGPATNVQLYNPCGVVLDNAGNCYIADSGNNRVRKLITSTGVIYTVAGNGEGGYSGDGGPATAARLSSPVGVLWDGSGNLYIASKWSGLIRAVDLNTGLIRTVAGGGAWGPSDGGPATAAHLGWPWGLALDSGGNLYFSDNLENQVRRVSASTGIITTVAGITNWPPTFSGDGGPATAADIYMPEGIAVDNGGILYIADSVNCRIRNVDLNTGVIGTMAGNGIWGSSGDGGPATSAKLLSPAGVTLDGFGNLYIADSGNARIRKVNLSTGVISSVDGNGIPGFGGDGGPATSAQLNAPAGLALDNNLNLLIADTGNNRVREVYACGYMPTATRTYSPTFSSTPSPSVTSTPSSTRTSTPVLSPTPTVTNTCSFSSTPTRTISATVTPTRSFSAPEKGTSFIFPSPARGDTASVAYFMANAGQVKIMFYNEAGELVDKVEDSKPAGPQTSAVTVRDFAPGVYYYVIHLTYGLGDSENQKPQKFVVIH